METHAWPLQSPALDTSETPILYIHARGSGKHPVQQLTVTRSGPPTLGYPGHSPPTPVPSVQCASGRICFAQASRSTFWNFSTSRLCPRKRIRLVLRNGYFRNYEIP